MNTSHTIKQATIAAIATPLGTGGVGIIRLSGDQSWAIATQLCPGKAFQHGAIAYRWLIEPNTNSPVDEVILLPFKAPSSLTGEDCVEIQCHGGLSLTQSILSLCLKAGAQLATPGEFTRRAVVNGKMDLTQAESILDLIHAEGEALLKVAASNLKYRHIGHWLEETLSEVASVQADLTASIDFPDEVEEPERGELTKTLDVTAQKIANRITLSQKNSIIRHGYKVALVGQPNAGKSSLFNLILAKEKAIVTDIAGTTRDVLEETIQINGIPVLLMDTAGLRNDSNDKVELIGIERTHNAVESADAIIWVIDASVPQKIEDIPLTNWQEKPGLIVMNKQDLPGFSDKLSILLPDNWQKITVSTQTSDGLQSIEKWLKALIEKELPCQNNIEALLSERQMAVLNCVLENVITSQATLGNPMLPLDLATVPLTDSLLALQGLLGRDTTEEMLDKVFSRFCVGK